MVFYLLKNGLSDKLVDMLDTIIIIIIVYILVIFVGARLIIPHMGFVKDKIPDRLPVGIEEIINHLKLESKDKKEFLQLAFNYIGDKYKSERFNTVLKFNYLFKSLTEVWNMSGYMPCPQTCYLMRMFLIKSGWFSEKDIKIKYVFVNFVPHQYLKVLVDGQWLSVDVGENKRGMPLGKHLKWFG